MRLSGPARTLHANCTPLRRPTVAVVEVARRLTRGRRPDGFGPTIQADYLENLESRKGRPSRLVLGASAAH